MPQKPAEAFPLIAALDLGSNSFHLCLAKANIHGEVRILERLGEKVQLAAGLDEERNLSEEATQRGLDCLRRFAQFISGMPQGSVRVVATNALREARNRSDFIRRAEEVLGHPVEVISGREEARLIYLGVANSMPDSGGRRLVSDIGGGSTEFIIGQLYDLVGRHQHEDVRERTISSLMQRYHVDPEQASRVEAKALKVLAEVGDAWELNDELHRDLLSWGARVHEIGLDIAHYHYHKHGAYLIEHSDLAGFSRQDQQMLSLLVRGHRRNIPADKLAEFAAEGDKLVRLCIVLRFAILFHHIRGTQEMPSVRLKAEPKSLSVTFPEGWLEANPLTQADFAQEAEWLKRVGYSLNVR